MNDTIIVFTIIILILIFINKKTLYILSLLFIIYLIYNIYLKSFTKNKENKEISNIYNINEKNIKKKKIVYPEKINNILDKIKKYSKFNINDYITGLKYLNEFFDNINILENENLNHYKQYLENSILYLNKSINHFQYITTSIPEYNLINKLKYNDHKIMKKSEKLSKLIKDLYNLCNNLLINITNKYNYKSDHNNYNYFININEPEASNNINLYNLY